MNFIDGSARAVLYTPEHAAGGAAFFFSAKSRDTFAPIGPYIVTADEIPDPYTLRVRSWISGKLVQDYPVSDMAHKIGDCIAWLSSIHTLEPGDIVALGTNHHGLHPIQDGDRIELETDGLGRLTVKVRDDLKRTWQRETRRERKLRTGKDGSAPQQGGKYVQAGT
jgi:2-keto-4-pentenoate hydratase/2-oxohepta-3-ene-1,7-dioic acid hydratase in catechol pathway